MRFLVLIILFPLYGFAGESSEALKKTTEAFSKTETGKKYLKKAEKIAYRMIPVGKETAATIGTTVLIFAGGGVTTKPLKNFNMDLMAGTFRPDFEYKFNSGEFTGNLKMNWEW